MGIISALKFITSHPLNKKNKGSAIFRFVKWQVNSILNPYPIIYDFTDKAKLIVQKGMTGATGNVYCGLHDYHDMAFLLHFLRPEDLFADIGANVGSYTVLASGHVGARALSVEPVPITFNHLNRNIGINNIGSKVRAVNVALGSNRGELKFTGGLDTMNHVSEGNELDTIDVPVETLDNLVRGETPLLMKIDVEGFETEVLNGASEVLESPHLMAIIIELNGSGTRYGYDELEIHNKLLKLDFKPYRYNPEDRTLEEVDGFGTHNTIYIKNLAFVQDRLKSASKIKVLRSEI